MPAELAQRQQPLLTARTAGRGVLERLVALTLDRLELPLPAFAALCLRLCSSLANSCCLDGCLLLLDGLGRLCQGRLLVCHCLPEVAELQLCIPLHQRAGLHLRVGPVHHCLRLAPPPLQCALHAAHGFAEDGSARLLADVPLALCCQAPGKPRHKQLQACGELASSQEPGEDRLALLRREELGLLLGLGDDGGNRSRRTLRGRALGRHGVLLPSNGAGESEWNGREQACC
mmetsp:Transcript_95853/g.254614  ORF Transcript_95853/g.254614 Transcript_95853/m.254614 type:complete len:231 (+) Transcript_95853:648-1340(+)